MTDTISEDWAEEVRAAKFMMKPHFDREDWQASTETWELASSSCTAAVGSAKAKRFDPHSFDLLDPNKPAVLLESMLSWDLDGLALPALQACFPSTQLGLTIATGSPEEAAQVSCDAFIDYLSSQEQPGNRADEEPISVFDRNVLYDDLRFSALYSVPDVPQLQFGNMLLDRLPPYSRPALRYLLLGPPRSGTEMHRDPDGTIAWNALAHGCKRWVFLAPGTPEELAKRSNPPEGFEQTIAEWFDQEWPSICEEAAVKGWPTYDFQQQPGEIVYTPLGWWHAVLNLESSVAITHNVLSRSALQKAVESAFGSVGQEPGFVLQDHIVTEAVVAAVCNDLGLMDDVNGVIALWLEDVYINRPLPEPT